MLIEQGLHANKAGVMYSLLQISQLPMTFLIPILAGRVKDQRFLVIIFSIFYCIGFGGLLLQLTTFTWLWMVLIGLAGGASFSLCMMFFSLRAQNALEATELSGFGQSIGYLLAAIGPVLYGLLHDAYGNYHSANLLYFAVTILLFSPPMLALKTDL